MKKKLFLIIFSLIFLFSLFFVIPDFIYFIFLILALSIVLAVSSFGKSGILKAILNKFETGDTGFGRIFKSIFFVNLLTVIFYYFAFFKNFEKTGYYFFILVLLADFFTAFFITNKTVKHKILIPLFFSVSGIIFYYFLYGSLLVIQLNILFAKFWD